MHTMASEFDILFASIAPDDVSLSFVTASCYVQAWLLFLFSLSFKDKVTHPLFFCWAKEIMYVTMFYYYLMPK